MLAEISSGEAEGNNVTSPAAAGMALNSPSEADGVVDST